MADEIKSANVQRGQIVAVFLWALRRANNDHRHLRVAVFQQAHHVPVSSVDKPESAKAGKHVIFCERRADLLGASGPDRIDAIAPQQFAHAVEDLRVNRRQHDAGSSGYSGGAWRILPFVPSPDRGSAWRNHHFCCLSGGLGEKCRPACPRFNECKSIVFCVLRVNNTVKALGKSGNSCRLAGGTILATFSCRYQPSAAWRAGRFQPLSTRTPCIVSRYEIIAPTLNPTRFPGLLVTCRMTAAESFA